MFRVSEKAEKFRLKTGPYASDKSFGCNGMFIIRSLKLKNPLKVIVSDGMGWEHVSVSLNYRCPVWEEMCFVKDLFWEDTDVVIQIHPAKDDHVNNHEYCLHLWRKAGTNDYCELPPSIMVGFK